MFASLRLRQANLATIVEWIEIHFDIYIYHGNTVYPGLHRIGIYIGDNDNTELRYILVTMITLTWSIYW